MKSRCGVGGIALLALVVTGCEDGGTEPRDVAAVVSGRAHAVDAGDLSSLWVVWEPTNRQPPDSAQIDADGNFRIEVTTTTGAGDLRIGGVDAPSYHPFLYPFSIGDLVDIDVVMVPRAWTIQTGDYAGSVVSTSLDIVVDDDTDRTFYTYIQGQPSPRVDPTGYLLDLMVWPEVALPARVAIDHPNSDRALTAADSSALWQVLDQMEDAFGRDLFEPVVADPDWWPVPTGPFDGEGVPGTIRIVSQAPGWRADVRFHEGAEVWEQDLGEWTSGGRFDSFRVNQRDLSGGALILGDFAPLQLADGLVDWRTVMAHEMLHVLGAGHTCRMESPMGPCARTAIPSRFDVAYLELVRETVRLQRELRTPYGLMPAIIGERRLLLGLPALPDLTG